MPLSSFSTFLNTAAGSVSSVAKGLSGDLWLSTVVMFSEPVPRPRMSMLGIKQVSIGS